MNKFLSLIATVFVVFTLIPSSWAWRPTGWVWSQWPFAFSLEANTWFYFNEADEQWVFGYAPGGGWNELEQSGLASGWSWYNWPFAYDVESMLWSYVDESSVQWVNNRSTDAWTRYGEYFEDDTMVLVPSGTFMMGDSFSEGYRFELPRRSVHVDSFYIEKYEVSWGLWSNVKAFSASNGYEFTNGGASLSDDRPVTSINWYDAVKWCNARSEMDGLEPVYFTDAGFNAVYRNGESVPYPKWNANGYRLPTEAEWEKAARGGLPGKRFPWGDEINHNYANYLASPEFYFFDTNPYSGGHPEFVDAMFTAPVGHFPANNFGLYDMCGNVWEICWDWFDEYFYSTGPTRNPRGAESGDLRVYRGGSKNSDALFQRVAARGGSQPHLEYGDVSFRCAKTLQTRVLVITFALNYGSVEIGAATNKTLVIRNSGNSTLTITNIVYPDGFSGISDAVIEAGSEIRTTINFRPTKRRLYDGMMSFQGNQTNDRADIRCTGTGVLLVPVNLAADPEGRGDVFGGGLLQAGTTQSISAVAVEAWQFDEWSDGVTNNPRIIVIPDTGISLFASFSLILTRIIEVEADLRYFEVEVGSSVSRRIAIRNFGNDTMIITNMIFPEGFSGFTNATIPPGTIRGYDINFTPVVATNYGGNIVVQGNITAGSNLIECSGRGFVLDSTPLGMKFIPAGQFAMGDFESIGSMDERPVHDVYTSGYFADEFEVSLDLWNLVKNHNSGNGYTFTNPGSAKNTNHPVHSINWYDAVKWCNARSEMDGLEPVYFTDANLTIIYQTGELVPHVNWLANGYRLPTEAEWEKAARGGVSGQRYPWGDTISHNYANYWDFPYFHPEFDDDNNPITSSSGYFQPNLYGLFDMSGNLAEWCWDRYSSSYYENSPSTNPTGPSSGSLRVVRGGSWYSFDSGCRSSARHLHFTDYNDNKVGFRCVRGL